jgi:hypothetical protein
MSRTITLIAAVGAPLAVAVPSAWSAPDPWSDGMNRKYGLGEYSPEVRALKLRSEALNKKYGLGKYASTATKSIDARERAMSVGREDPTISMLDAREQAFAAKRNVQLSTGTPPDVFERAVAAQVTGTRDHFVANDDRFRVEPATPPDTVTVSSSGREIEWPQVGIGFAVGIALLLGLLLALRIRRQPPLAH